MGNQIDSIIRLISDSQTNGIPQGSILMDFIAEIVLFYLDREISVKIKNQEISDFKIIRWRDDYGTVEFQICFNFLLVLRRNFGYF